MTKRGKQVIRKAGARKLGFIDVPKRIKPGIINETVDLQSSQVGWARFCAHAVSVNHTPAPHYPSRSPNHAHISHHAHSQAVS